MPLLRDQAPCSLDSPVSHQGSLQSYRIIRQQTPWVFVREFHQLRPQHLTQELLCLFVGSIQGCGIPKRVLRVFNAQHGQRRVGIGCVGTIIDSIDSRSIPSFDALVW
jgi:hypothetical protein